MFRKRHKPDYAEIHRLEIEDGIIEPDKPEEKPYSLRHNWEKDESGGMVITKLRAEDFSPPTAPLQLVGASRASRSHPG